MGILLKAYVNKIDKQIVIALDRQSSIIKAVELLKLPRAKNVQEFFHFLVV